MRKLVTPIHFRYTMSTTRYPNIVFEREVLLICLSRDTSVSILLLVVFFQLGDLPKHKTLAGVLTIDTPIGPVSIDLEHAGPRGSLIVSRPTHSDAFRPPSIFSAPLPSGSGARALGLAGAFTAVADDATAASWNPAGLTQLERPEVSGVLRFSHERDKHHSRDASFSAGDDDFSRFTLNYLSLVYPFYSPSIKRNVVISLNLQEAYDFTQSFTARPTGSPVTTTSNTSSKNFLGSGTRTVVKTETGASMDPGSGSTVTLHLTEQTTTRASTLSLEDLFGSAVVSELDFEQEGVISAFSPAMAVELTSKLSFGLAVNYYHSDPSSGDSIRSETFGSNQWSLL